MTEDKSASLENIGLFESLQAVLSTVDEGIHIIDDQGITLFYNQAASKLDNLLPEEVLGKHLLEVFPNLTRESSTLLKVLETGEPILNQQQTFANFKGKQITTINSTLPLFQDNQVVGAIEISKDITQVKELSEKVSLLQQELFRSSKTQGSDQSKAQVRELKDKDIPLKEKSPGTRYTFDDFTYKSEQMDHLIHLSKRVSLIDSPVLVYGDTGTGKELLVEAIHNYSPRNKGPYLSQNCASLPGDLLTYVLFGTVEGSFPGSQDKPGLFELADGGTLFLDEITALPYEAQTSLLQVLQYHEIKRVGDTRTRPVNTRVIASMDIHPSDALKQKVLRDELCIRLNAVSLRIPPLSERTQDIEPLAFGFLEKYRQKFKLEVDTLSEDVLELFRKYHWPGNVRELEHVIEGAVTLSTDSTIKMENLPPHLQEVKDIKERPTQSSNGKIQPLRDAIQSLEKQLIERALNSAGGNISWAAQLLQIPRQTLQYKMKTYGFKANPDR